MHHALKINREACVGCSLCMRVCPTEALRVSGGKAVMFPDWCVDCGECYRVCPQRAIRVDDDDIKQIFDYKYRILLVPLVFYAQFDSRISRELIDAYLSAEGFTEICAVEQGVDILSEQMEAYMKEHPKPVISTFCPAVTRLVQVRFPVLVDHLMRLLPPVEITALYYKKLYAERGVPDNEVGIFYLTPCAAKIAVVKAPIGGYVSPITGVINMDHLYNKVYLAYKNRRDVPPPTGVVGSVSAKGARWTVTGGESKHVKGRCLAIDGIPNIIEFLEQLENDKIEGVDFLELRVCDESCSGGILAMGNRFLTVERLKKIARASHAGHDLTDDYRRLCADGIPVEPILPRSMVKYDKDIKVALAKMADTRKLHERLPGIDCGACGAPSCGALAEDVVCRGASVGACFIMRAEMEGTGEMTAAEGTDVVEGIWGSDKFKSR